MKYESDKLIYSNNLQVLIQSFKKKKCIEIILIKTYPTIHYLKQIRNISIAVVAIIKINRWALI